jgi:hypothetical protein
MNISSPSDTPQSVRLYHEIKNVADMMEPGIVEDLEEMLRKQDSKSRKEGDHNAFGSPSARSKVSRKKHAPMSPPRITRAMSRRTGENMDVDRE